MSEGLGDQVRIERVLPAPIDEVFKAWTDPARMAKWLSPAGHAEAEVDLRVSGRFRVAMIDGTTRIEHTGEYLVVDPPGELSFTWRSPYTGSHPSVVTVSLAPQGEATRMVLTHRRLPDDQVRPHADGWRAIVERLAGLLGATGVEAS